MSDLESRANRTGLIARAVRVLALAGGALLLAQAIMVSTSVALRALGRDPVAGDFELVQMAMAVVVFAFLPLCQWRRANIAVDTFTSALPAHWRRGLDTAWDLVYALMAGFLAYTLAQGARETLANGTETMVLRLPIWPAIALSAALALVLAATALATALRGLTTR